MQKRTHHLHGHVTTIRESERALHPLKATSGHMLNRAPQVGAGGALSPRIFVGLSGDVGTIWYSLAAYLGARSSSMLLPRTVVGRGGGTSTIRICFGSVDFGCAVHGANSILRLSPVLYGCGGVRVAGDISYGVLGSVYFREGFRVAKGRIDHTRHRCCLCHRCRCCLRRHYWHHHLHHKS